MTHQPRKNYPYSVLGPRVLDMLAGRGDMIPGREIARMVYAPDLVPPYCPVKQISKIVARLRDEGHEIESDRGGNGRAGGYRLVGS